MRVPVLTDGVVARVAWEPADGGWYAMVVTTDEMIRRFTAESPGTTGADVRAGIARLAGSAREAGFLITDAVTGERLGNIAAHWADDRIGRVSYWLTAAARGRGVGTRALTMFVDLLSGPLDLTELRLQARADNVGSRRLAERAGFVRDPDRDEVRQWEEEPWDMVGYRRLAPRSASP